MLRASKLVRRPLSSLFNVVYDKKARELQVNIKDTSVAFGKYYMRGNLLDINPLHQLNIFKRYPDMYLYGYKFTILGKEFTDNHVRWAINGALVAALVLWGGFELEHYFSNCFLITLVLSVPIFVVIMLLQ